MAAEVLALEASFVHGKPCLAAGVTEIEQLILS
jgi:hypothetical protein